VRATILAASGNPKLLELNRRKPPTLIKINGTPLLEHQIRGYLKAGVEMASISVVTGYRYNQIKRFLTRTYPEIRILKSSDHGFTSAVDSLHCALQSVCSDTRESLFISNGACMYDDQIITRLAQQPASAVAGDTSKHDNGGIMVAVDSGRVIRASAAPSTGTVTAVFAEVCKIDAEALIKLKAVLAKHAEKRVGENPLEHVLNDLVRATRVAFVDTAGAKWAAIRTMDDLGAADKRFSRFVLRRKRCFVCDLDGTVYVGSRPVRGTVAFIERHRNDIEFFFVTNNTSKLPEDYIARLAALGVRTDLDHVLTPLAPLIAYLNEHAIATACLLANARVTDYLRQALPDLELTADPVGCEALIVTYDTELSYAKLRDAALLLQNNPQLTFLATHGDLVCPTERGFVPDSGCILLALERTTGRMPSIVFGKPNPLLLERVRRSCGADEMVVVGDRMYTDGLIARSVGCDFICVLSGETTREQIDELREDEFPSLIAKDLGALLT
jgi:4-nitrophenyl phosphatase